MQQVSAIQVHNILLYRRRCALFLFTGHESRGLVTEPNWFRQAAYWDTVNLPFLITDIFPSFFRHYVSVVVATSRRRGWDNYRNPTKKYP